MKNLTYIPFKKNRYFYGKLLTAEDFEQEQQYMDNKRRLINRWVLGAGIVAGLEVIRVDDYSVSVEVGLALDFTGREIVVDMPVIRKLSLLDGYQEATDAEGAESLYLYIEYDQIQAEPVHNITDRSVHAKEEECYNKYQESYHLYVSDDEPVREPGCGLWEGVSEYIRDRAEAIRQDTYRQGICLAKIHLVKAGDFYMIEQIHAMTDRQWVLSQPASAGMLREMSMQLTGLEQRVLGIASGDAKRPDQTTDNTLVDWQFQQGQITVPVPEGARAGVCIYTDEIAHGLGLGNVELLLHVFGKDAVYSGAEDVFPEAEKQAEAAARLNRNTGTFRIGIRLLVRPDEPEVTVGWTAIRKQSRNEIQDEDPQIYINPGVIQLKTRESIGLKAVCADMEEKELFWNVITPEGGRVDEDGTYYAPNKPGVYQVECGKHGQDRPRTSVYVIVRE